METSPERCVVTVLAVDVVGSTRHIAGVDPDIVQDFFDECFRYVSESVEHAGGFMVDYGGDGGIAVFGWPGSLEDHADRACAAAWRLQRRARQPILGPDKRSVQFRVGLDSGLVSIRTLQRDDRSRINVSGTPVNIAASLQKHAAPGGMLLSGETLGLARVQLSVTQREAPDALAQLKVEMFTLDADPARTASGSLTQRYKTPIVGRAGERASVRQALEAAGDATLALAIVGEPGVGKSRLAAAVVEDALTKYTRTLAFFGDAQKHTTPFAAPRSLIGDAAEMAPAGLRGALVAGGLSTDAIEAVEAVFSGAQSATKRRTAALTQTQITSILVDAFCILALNEPTTLLIEDLHLVDAESRHFLRLLARSRTPRPLFILITGRPESQFDATAISTSVINLAPLPLADMATLARRLWEANHLPDDVVQRLLDRADGVPFVLEELVASLDRANIDAFNPLPQSVASVIHARMNRLSADAKRTVQAISLLGEETDTALARSVVGGAPERFARDLVELEQYAFIHPPLGRSVRFRHQIVAQACAETVPRKRRERLHADAVAALTLASEDLTGQYERLAFHAEGAGDDLGALNYLWQSAIEARNASAAVSLSLTLDHALKLSERIGEPAQEKFVDFVLMAFASMIQMGEFSKMNAVLPRTMELARLQDRPDKVCGAMSQMAMLCWFEGRYAEGLKIAESALTIARSLGSLPLIFSNQLMLANTLHGMGEVRRALTTLEELCDLLVGELETARLGAAAIPSSTALAFMSWFLLDIGEYEQAVAHGERALAIAVREQDAYSEVLARHSLGRSLLLAGRRGEAVECLRIVLDLSEANGYDAIKPHATGSLASALARNGRASEAIPLVQACFDAGLHLRTGKLEVYHLYAGYAEALFESGDRDGAIATSDYAIELARGVGNPCMLAHGLGIRANLRARMNFADAQARADLAEQSDICARHSLVPWSAGRGQTN